MFKTSSGKYVRYEENLSFCEFAHPIKLFSTDVIVDVLNTVYVDLYDIKFKIKTNIDIVKVACTLMDFYPVYGVVIYVIDSKSDAWLALHDPKTNVTEPFEKISWLSDVRDMDISTDGGCIYALTKNKLYSIGCTENLVFQCPRVREVSNLKLTDEAFFDKLIEIPFGGIDDLVCGKYVRNIDELTDTPYIEMGYEIYKILDDDPEYYASHWIDNNIAENGSCTLKGALSCTIDNAVDVTSYGEDLIFVITTEGKIQCFNFRYQDGVFQKFDAEKIEKPKEIHCEGNTIELLDGDNFVHLLTQYPKVKRAVN